ncbi:hypothetical protein MUP35_03360 [Patescibacteria group bacterium]|nr:hypothetical protein [Patescibacteria group bacterium]
MKEEQTPRFLNDILVEKKLGGMKVRKFPPYFAADSLIEKFGKVKGNGDYKRISTDLIEFKKGKNLFRAYLSTGVLPSTVFHLHIFYRFGKSQNKSETNISLNLEENLIEFENYERELTNREERDLAKFFISMKKKLEVLKEKEIKNDGKRIN